MSNAFSPVHHITKLSQEKFYMIFLDTTFHIYNVSCFLTFVESQNITDVVTQNEQLQERNINEGLFCYK